MPFPILLLLRLPVVAFWLLTAAYGIVCFSPFAFDMFIRPQLVPWIQQFVSWHHAWHGGAYVAALITLTPLLTRRTYADRRARVARGLAVGYGVVMGALSVWLASSPLLPTLWNDSRSFAIGCAGLLPPVWLAAIDHLAAGEPWSRAGRATLGAGRSLAACVVAAVYFWTAHLGAAALQLGVDHALAWTLTGVWTLVLTITAAAFVFVVLAVIAAAASHTAHPAAWEYVLIAIAAAAGLAVFVATRLLPTIAVNGSAAWAAAGLLAMMLVACWSGLSWQRASRSPRTRADALDLLLTSSRPRVPAVMLFVALAAMVLPTLRTLEQIDWDFVLQRMVVLAEAIAAFAVALHIVRGGRGPRSWAGPAVAVAVVPLVAMVVVPRAAAAIATATGDASLRPDALFERHAASAVAFRLPASALVRSAAHDAEYYRHLQVNGAPSATVTIPDVSFAVNGRPARRPPDVFVFAIDSLRRDYLSPYNPRVRFTPSIDRFARESFVFRNAFTRHGGTELAMPALWAGTTVMRRVRAPGFERMNTLEKLIAGEGYRIAINDYTIAGLLKTDDVTFLDPGIRSADTDLCQNVASLRAYLERPSRQPVFAFLAPMNVHILNTRRPGVAGTPEGSYGGFYAPYAQRLERLDRCFGEFMAFLKEQGRFDESIVVLTSDHGDSLGENGYWGHAFWLFPEDIRLPLIVHVPRSMRERLTTDLARLTFATDITPTLYALLGHTFPVDGPLAGAPLFVDTAGTLIDRRRSAELVTSSYASTYGLLRRNGRFLYVSDLYERKEFAFDLGPQPLGAPRFVDETERRLNRRLIRERVDAVARLYAVRHTAVR